MLVTLFGIVIFVKWSQPENALSPILSTVFPTITSTTLFLFGIVF